MSVQPAPATRDPLPGDELADWQLRLGMVGFRWLPITIQVLYVLVPLAAIGWAVIGGLEHYWTGLLKIAGGLTVGWVLSRQTELAYMIALEGFNAFHLVHENRQRQRDNRGYFLFLRSFRDDAFAIHHTITAASSSHVTVTIDNLSDLLEDGLEKYGRFIMIGKEPTADPFLDASVMAQSDDANWWSLFQRLVANARCVFLVPETSTGLLREIREVVNGPQLRKAVVVMPRVDAQGVRARRWDELRTALAQEGFELPLYDPAGCFYLPDLQLRMQSTFSFGNGRSIPSAMRRAFRKVEAALPRDTTPFKEALTWVELAAGEFPAEGGRALEGR